MCLVGLYSATQPITIHSRKVQPTHCPKLTLYIPGTYILLEVCMFVSSLMSTFHHALGNSKAEFVNLPCAVNLSIKQNWWRSKRQNQRRFLFLSATSNQQRWLPAKPSRPPATASQITEHYRRNAKTADATAVSCVLCFTVLVLHALMMAWINTQCSNPHAPGRVSHFTNKGDMLHSTPQVYKCTWSCIQVLYIRATSCTCIQVFKYTR